MYRHVMLFGLLHVGHLLLLQQILMCVCMVRVHQSQYKDQVDDGRHDGKPKK